MESILNEPEPGVWSQIAPLLDEALNCLGEREHDAVVLRFFDGKELKQVGAAMGTTEDAARMRVNRGVEKLRNFFTKRGVTLSAPAIAGVVSANSIQAAPAGLAASITAAALSGTAITTTAIIAVTKALAMTTLQKTIVAATVVVLTGAGVYEARQAANARAEVKTLQRQQRMPLTEQIQQLQHQRDEAKNQLVALTDEIAKVKGNTSELLKLRGLVARLRGETSQINDPSVQTALAWAAKKEKLQKIFAERPELQIPEMQFLTDANWLALVKELDLDSEAGIHFAIGAARTGAKMNSATIIQNALRKFMEANNGRLPNDVSQLTPFLDGHMDDTILQRYKLLDNATNPLGATQGMVLIETVAGDKGSEPLVSIGPGGTALVAPPDPVHLTLPQELRPVMEFYQAQNPQKMPSNFDELRPYISTPEQQAALDKLIRAGADALNRDK